MAFAIRVVEPPASTSRNLFSLRDRKQKKAPHSEPRRRLWRSVSRARTVEADAPEAAARQIALQCPWLSNVPYIGASGDLGRVAAVVAKHYRGEFCWSSSFDAPFVAALMSRGFLTMAQRVGRDSYALLPKMHRHRCALELDAVHTARSTRRKSARFALSSDRAFDAVVAGVHAQHGSECWFYPPLVAAFRELHAASGGASVVRMRSFECWDKETGELVAGELGYAVGDVYTSLSGFSKAPSAGAVQCAATARALRRSGYSLWDLGMELPYKVAMGATLLPRDTFLKRLAAARARGPVAFDAAEKRTCCRELIDDVPLLSLPRVVTPEGTDDSASNASSDIASSPDVVSPDLVLRAVAACSCRRVECVCPGVARDVPPGANGGLI